MTAGDGRNTPRWRGAPGFFEIWFVVVFDLAGRRAWWIRYTTFAPRAGPARGSVWAAAFEGDRPARYGKAFVAVEDVAAAVAALDHGRCAGAVDAGGTPIAWELAFEPARHPAERGPRWLDRLPAPTRVVHANQEVVFRGRVRVGDREHVVSGARGAQKHLWGTRRVEELFWVYAPVLDGGGAFEASSVRLRRGRGPAIAPVWLHDGSGARGWWGLSAVFRNRVVPDGPGVLRVRAAAATRRLEAIARYDPRTLAGYVYRDPGGWDVHVAQTDVARCELVVRSRRHALARWGAPQRLAAALAAVELHHPEPLPGVCYVPWDGTTAS